MKKSISKKIVVVAVAVAVACVAFAGGAFTAGEVASRPATQDTASRQEASLPEGVECPPQVGEGLPGETDMVNSIASQYGVDVHTVLEMNSGAAQVAYFQDEYLRYLNRLQEATSYEERRKQTINVQGSAQTVQIETREYAQEWSGPDAAAASAVFAWHRENTTVDNYEIRDFEKDQYVWDACEQAGQLGEEVNELDSSSLPAPAGPTSSEPSSSTASDLAEDLGPMIEQVGPAGMSGREIETLAGCVAEKVESRLSEATIEVIRTRDVEADIASEDAQILSDAVSECRAGA